MLRIFQLNLRWRIERESMKCEIFAICLRLSYACRSFVHWILVTSLDSLESCMFIWLCSSTFFSFSAYAEVWCVRLDQMLQRRLSLAWRSHIWFYSLILCEFDLLVDLTSRSWIACVSLSFKHLIACDESRLCHSVFWSWLTSTLCSWYWAKQWVNTVPRTKSSRALSNQITTPSASTIEPSNSAGELQYLGWLFSSIWSMIPQSIFSMPALRYN